MTVIGAGEQGFIDGRNMHGNLMQAMLLFGQSKE
jgi:hypothetical protein